MANNLEQKTQDLHQYLFTKYKIASPKAGRGLKPVSDKFSDFENAAHVIAAMTLPMDTRDSSGFKMLDATPLDPELHKVADIAFKIARIAAREKIPPAVAVHNYILSLLADHSPQEPLNIVSNPAFESMAFRRDDRTGISGRVILKEAVKGLRAEQSASV